MTNDEMQNLVDGGSIANHVNLVPGAVISDEDTVHGSMFFSNSSNDINRLETIRELFHIFTEAQIEGWDGYEARPANPKSMVNAIKIIFGMQPNYISPDVAIDVDGDVSLDWGDGPRNSVSLRIGETGDIYFAAMMGFSAKSGTYHFVHKIPENLENELVSYALTE